MYFILLCVLNNCKVMDYAMASLRMAITTEKDHVVTLKKKAKAQAKSHHHKEKNATTELKQALRIALREAEDAEKAQKEACSSMSAASGEAAAQVEALKRRQEQVEAEVESAKLATELLRAQLHAREKQGGKGRRADKEQALTSLQGQKQAAEARIALARRALCDTQSDEAALERELAQMATALEQSRGEISRYKVDLMSLDARMATENELAELEAVCARKQKVVASLTTELERVAAAGGRKEDEDPKVIVEKRKNKINVGGKQQQGSQTSMAPAELLTAGSTEGPAWFLSRRGVINAS